MFIEYKNVRRLDPEKSLNKPFENVSRRGRIQNFFQGREYQISTFLSIFFPEE